MCVCVRPRLYLQKLTGSAYEAKLEHCSNFMHWAPFEMAPDGTAMNLFPRERAEMRRCACQGSSSHCIEDSALFLLMGQFELIVA